MSKSMYKSIADENGFLTLYLYNDEIEPENGIAISIMNIDEVEWQSIFKEVNNRLVKLVESDPSRLYTLNDLVLNVSRALIAQQLNNKTK